jgi:hypothetical protein
MVRFRIRESHTLVPLSYLHNFSISLSPRLPLTLTQFLFELSSLSHISLDPEESINHLSNIPKMTVEMRRKASGETESSSSQYVAAPRSPSFEDEVPKDSPPRSNA